MNPPLDGELDWEGAQTHIEYACFNASGQQVSGVGSFGHISALISDSLSRPGDHIKQRIVITVRGEWGGDDEPTS